MKYIIIFISSFLFAFKNDAYLTMLENNIIINYLNNSISKTQNININPKIKKIINTSPDKFLTGNAKIDSTGTKKVSIGVEFDFQKKVTQTILVDNKEIFNINRYFQNNSKIIECYKNNVLFNLNLFFIKVAKYDKFYSRFLPLFKNTYPCNTKKSITFFQLNKVKNVNITPMFSITKKRNITSSVNLNLNQDTKTYVSASFNIKIPLEKSYKNEDIAKLQSINTSMNKINTLVLKINNSIDNYQEILKENKKILIKLKLLTLISKIAPANLNYDKLIGLYESFFKNLYTLNNIQRDIFINKFLLKTEKRKISAY